MANHQYKRSAKRSEDTSFLEEVEFHCDASEEFIQEQNCWLILQQRTPADKCKEVYGSRKSSSGLLTSVLLMGMFFMKFIF